MNPIRTALSLGALALAAACSPLGLVDMARLDPLNTPPAALGLALGVPNAVALRDGDAVLRLAFARDGEMLVDTRVPLSVRRGLPDAQVPSLPGEVLYAVTLAPAEAATVAAAQAEIRALRAAGTEGEGTLSITVVGGCRTGAALDALPVTTWLRTDPSVPYAPLTRRADALDAMRAAGVDVPPCG